MAAASTPAAPTQTVGRSPISIAGPPATGSASAPAEMTDDRQARTRIVSWRIAAPTVGILLAGGLPRG